MKSGVWLCLQARERIIVSIWHVQSGASAVQNTHETSFFAQRKCHHISGPTQEGKGQKFRALVDHGAGVVDDPVAAAY